ncbi:MAG TPA: hypothetical protein VGR38_03060, partial [Candidatus Polarisedimenticolia bacterium]|nr:hypothetical protein [Candidatus Polarisedimenticolia bacterium]
GDVVLKGEFALVALRCVTLDPGTSGTGGGAVFEQAVDGRQLGPVRLWIEGRIRRLMIERSIVGPVRARAGGIVESLEVRDSIVQAIPTAATSDPALSLADGEVALERVTVMGAASVHRLRASETILDGVAAVEDVQRGCVRFSAWVTGSVLPRQYESVEIPAGAPIFTARFFGFPGYAQVLDEADAQIVGSGDRGSITQGAQDGSEMGAFACERRAIKERSLRIKLQEFMPIGLIPVLIHVT